MASGIAGLFLANPIVTAEGLDAKAWLALTYIVLAGTVSAFWLYLACLKYISPVTAGLVVCLEPTSAYVFGIMFMNLKLGWIECLGIAMVISQVCLVLEKVLMFPCVNWSRVFICLNKSSKF